jgi:hypothetical protein
METFPIVKRKDEKQYGVYRTKRVILEMYDEMRRAVKMGEVYRTRLVPGLEDGGRDTIVLFITFKYVYILGEFRFYDDFLIAKPNDGTYVHCNSFMLLPPRMSEHNNPDETTTLAGVYFYFGVGEDVRFPYSRFSILLDD